MDDRNGGDDSPTDELRRIEVHFADHDQAMVLELREDPDRRDVESLIGALEARDIDEAERQLARRDDGPRAIARIGQFRHR
jgi:hypothetical protein